MTRTRLRGNWERRLVEVLERWRWDVVARLGEPAAAGVPADCDEGENTRCRADCGSSVVAGWDGGALSGLKRGVRAANEEFRRAAHRAEYRDRCGREKKEALPSNVVAGVRR